MPIASKFCIFLHYGGCRDSFAVSTSSSHGALWEAQLRPLGEEIHICCVSTTPRALGHSAQCDRPLSQPRLWAEGKEWLPTVRTDGGGIQTHPTGTPEPGSALQRDERLAGGSRRFSEGAHRRLVVPLPPTTSAGSAQLACFSEGAELALPSLIRDHIQP